MVGDSKREAERVRYVRECLEHQDRHGGLHPVACGGRGQQHGHVRAAFDEHRQDQGLKALRTEHSDAYDDVGQRSADTGAEPA